ncbi:DUF689-domain-containing protein [Backusella circina FSU 941]|nr:DUF689-domain-containing protein [Backusella circina FSU 941]
MNNFDYIKPTGSTAVIVPNTIDKDSVEKIASISPLLKLGYFDSVEWTPSSFDLVYSNPIQPSVYLHSNQIFSNLLRYLKAGGQLVLEEVVLSVDLASTVCPITRNAAQLESLLKLAGFVDVSTVDRVPVSDSTLADYFRLWGTNKIEQGTSRLTGKFEKVRILAKKPAYEVGQKVSLKRRDKKTVWQTIQDDGELEDEDNLLDDDDKMKPTKESLEKPDDCELTDGKRKACKNCTCGRAEDDVVALDLMDEDEDEVVEVDPTPKKTGGCGSCALGDAFRCATCPYLGMPAFSVGQNITISGTFGEDDL